MTFNGLHGVVTQKIELFKTTAVRTSVTYTERVVTFLTGPAVQVTLKVCIWKVLYSSLALDIGYPDRFFFFRDPQQSL
jgi:hypothetical protein